MHCLLWAGRDIQDESRSDFSTILDIIDSYMKRRDPNVSRCLHVFSLEKDAEQNDLLIGMRHRFSLSLSSTPFPICSFGMFSILHISHFPTSSSSEYQQCLSAASKSDWRVRALQGLPIDAIFSECKRAKSLSLPHISLPASGEEMPSLNVVLPPPFVLFTEKLVRSNYLEV
jgi:hypothetical protein